MQANFSFQKNDRAIKKDHNRSNLNHEKVLRPNRNPNYDFIPEKPSDINLVGKETRKLRSFLREVKDQDLHRVRAPCKTLVRNTS